MSTFLMDGNNFTLPVEIWDTIWLNCDEDTIRRTRKLQSEYVKEITNCFTFDDAVRAGNLKNLKWLLKLHNPKRARMERITFSTAARIGNLEVMKWLLDNGCEWSPNTCEIAAVHGNVQNLIGLKKIIVPGIIKKSLAAHLE
ncbi:hypothetical protein HDV04_005718 [Boothiomyces sp. JEL0838]|nr:hypothetical protein HDV04_005718 [Boothiomyces sp. JEL0838]